MTNSEREFAYGATTVCDAETGTRATCPAVAAGHEPPLDGGIQQAVLQYDDFARARTSGTAYAGIVGEEQARAFWMHAVRFLQSTSTGAQAGDDAEDIARTLGWLE